MERSDSHTPLLSGDSGDFERNLLGMDDSSTEHADQLDNPTIRARLEHQLLRKLDRRMSVLLLIYILNYVRHLIRLRFGSQLC